MSPRARCLACFAFLVPAAACQGSKGGASSGGGDGAGGCPLTPEPLFTLTVTASGELVPPDTTVRVTWSAATEPAFVLDDPSTWKTLDDANVVCDVDRDAGPPDALQALVCQLWTSGPTEVAVSAHGFIASDRTFTPKESEVCARPVPSDIAVVLQREADGGER